MFLKSLHLKNYCYYEEHRFDFVKSDGKPYPFVCFFGPNGFGKCLSSDTFINMPEKGMIPIGDLFVDKDLIPDSWYEFDGSIDCNGKPYAVKNIYYNGKKPTIKIKTSCGYTLEGSAAKHKILSIFKNNICFRKLSDLKIGDTVCISRRNIFPEDNNEMPSGVSELLGYIISEGNVTKKYISFTNTDSDVLKHFMYLCNNNLKFFKSNVCKQKRLNRKEISCIYIRQKDLKYLCDFGLTICNSENKIVPKGILSGSKENIQSFLRSYFEGDGGIEKETKGISCCSKSYELLHQIHLLLLRLGIVSSLKRKHVDKLSYNKKPYTSWRIFIHGEDVFSFAKEIGFISSRKKEELNNVLSYMLESKRNPNKDVIPFELLCQWNKNTKQIIKENHIKFKIAVYKDSSSGMHCLQDNYLQTVKRGVSYGKIKNCIKTINTALESKNICVRIEEPEFLNKDYFFDEIETIEYGYNDLFDISVENKHSFWSNGFISHNTMALEAIILLTMNTRGIPPFILNQRLRKYVHSEEYIPSLDRVEHGMTKKITVGEDFYVPLNTKMSDKTQMLIEGVFNIDGQEYIVALTENGFTRNDLAPVAPPESESEDVSRIMATGPWGKDHFSYRQRVSHLMSTDSDLSLSKFQIRREYMEIFEKIIELIMRFKAEGVDTSIIEKEYCTDFVLHKKKRSGKIIKTHYKSMSAGERKISKIFSQVFNMIHELEHPREGERPMPGFPALLLMDNIEMHAYYDRHIQIVECMKTVFDKQQIFATTHSGVLIPRCMRGENDQENELWIDIEPING